MERQYSIGRTCNDCGNLEEFPVTLLEAAFDHDKCHEIRKTPCSKCSSTSNVGIFQQTPELNKDLLDLWGSDSSRSFFEQDEDLMLADERNIEMFLDAIDNSNYIESKITTLIEALFVLIYDDLETKKKTPIIENLKASLIERRDILLKHKDSVYDYIGDKVYPELGL